MCTRNPGVFLLAVVALTCAICLGFSRNSYAVPSYARQTGMACEACHTVFPELTPFGRVFKLNGYVVDNLPQVEGITTNKEQALLLNQMPPLSLMFQTSYTRTKQALPDSAIPGVNAQDGQVLFPQQASLFYAGRIAPNTGAFIQITYDSASGNVHWDNTDIRYANQVAAVTDGLTYGVTLNNNPTVQDVWNSTPAWQTPFDQRTSAAPIPAAATQIDQKLGGAVAGLTAYAWWKNSIYGEVGLYRSAPQGFQNGLPNNNNASGPLDSTSGAISGYAPYWRLAYEHQWDRNSLMVGTYGIDLKTHPAGAPITPPTDDFRDWAVDAQYQFIGDDHMVSVQTT